MDKRKRILSIAGLGMIMLVISCYPVNQTAEYLVPYWDFDFDTGSTEPRDSEFNTCKNNGVDECNTWGDYFYLEALTRLTKDWNLYW